MSTTDYGHWIKQRSLEIRRDKLRERLKHAQAMLPIARRTSEVGASVDYWEAEIASITAQMLEL
jgi:hypothetical protein